MPPRLRFVVATFGLVFLVTAPAAADIILFADGGVHTVSDNTYALDSIQVEDTTGGASTTLTLTGGLIGTDPGMDPDSATWSILGNATHGGRAHINILGGTTLSGIQASDATCTLVDGGTVLGGEFSRGITARAASDTAVVRVNTGTVDGLIWSHDGGRVTITGGTISLGPRQSSVTAQGTYRVGIVNMSGGTLLGSIFATTNGRVYVTGGDVGGFAYAFDSGSLSITDGTFSGGAAASEGGRLEISGGSFGANLSGVSLRAYSSRVRASGGDFLGSAEANDDSQLTISGGTFGANGNGEPSYSPSVEAVSNSIEPARVTISDGSFDGGVNAFDNSRVGLWGGSFGRGRDDSLGGINSSVLASSSLPNKPAKVEIFGGTYSDGLDAGEFGKIHIYGTGLTKTAGMVSGTLQDGTPINLPFLETGSGEIVLHSPLQITQIPAGIWWLGGISPVLIKLPPGLVAFEPDCQGGFMPAPEIGFKNPEQAPPQYAVFRFPQMARNPLAPPYQTTTPVELLELQLESVDPVQLTGLDGSFEKLFVTLQSRRGVNPGDPAPGRANQGTMTVDFGMRTFTMDVDLFYDIREGSLSGPILFSGSDTLATESPVPWAPTPPEGALRDLPDGGFFPGVVAGAPFEFSLVGSDLGFNPHTPLAAPVPLPATGPGAALALAALLLFAAYRRLSA